MNVRWSRWASPFIAVLALASSAVGIVNRFTYDDRYIIELNPVMRSLAWLVARVLNDRTGRKTGAATAIVR